jgi:hypothetical protein
MKNMSPVQEHERSARKVYVAPRIVNFGFVRDLTRTGTTSGNEGPNYGQCMNNKFFNKCSSERRVKENIVRVGEHPLGFGLYLFDYRAEYRGTFGCGRQFGVMIDEVETVVPKAVSIYPDGFKRVDYQMLGIHRFANN